MLDMLIGCASAFVTLLAFLIGFLMGRGACEKKRAERSGDRFLREFDQEKQLKFEADQQALAECMNYSIDVAYRGMK